LLQLSQARVLSLSLAFKYTHILTIPSRVELSQLTTPQALINSYASENCTHTHTHPHMYT